MQQPDLGKRAQLSVKIRRKVDAAFGKFIIVEVRIMADQLVCLGKML